MDNSLHAVDSSKTDSQTKKVTHFKNTISKMINLIFFSILSFALGIVSRPSSQLLVSNSVSSSSVDIL